MKTHKKTNWIHSAALCLAMALAWGAGSSTARADQPERSETDQVRRFALVVGTNNSLDRKQAPLRFADDDAARIADLLKDAGVDVELLTGFDKDTQEIYPDLVGRARTPTRKALWQAFGQLGARMEQAREDGAERVELIIYYSGHGDVGPDGQGYLTLSDGKFKRSDLFGRILKKSTADHNHLVIDACRSEQFVLSRGKKKWKADAGPDATARMQRYLDRNQLGAYPNTGVIVAHSADQQTHEWERYHGGIFTHQLASGLRGAADLNGDGRIEYSELGAFVAAANSGVKDPRARLQVVVRPPADDQRHPILVHADVGRARSILFTKTDANRYTIEDGRGVRLADIRRSAEGPGYLRLPPQGPIFVRRHGETPGADEETTIGPNTTGVIRIAGLDFSPIKGSARGSLDLAFRQGLFATPFGVGYYQGYTDQHSLLPVQDPKWRVKIWSDEDGEVIVDGHIDSDPDLAFATGDADTEEVVEIVETTTERGGLLGTWGGLFVGTIITPFNPEGRIETTSKRVISNQFRGCLAPLVGTDRGCSAVRGFDVRWQMFHLSKRGKYPRWLGYFRTGYTAGHAEFNGLDEAVAEDPQTDALASLSYLTVPLFLGGNVYVLDNFPVRPYAGLGFGFDVLRVDYRRANGDKRTDVSARIGFELHAGVEARITNYVSLNAEVMQLWSARRKLSNVPDYSNEGFTLVLGAAFAMPLRRNGTMVKKRVRTQIRRRREPASTARQTPAPPTTPAVPVPATPPETPVAPEPPAAPEPPPATAAPGDNSSAP